LAKHNSGLQGVHLCASSPTYLLTYTSYSFFVSVISLSFSLSLSLESLLDCFTANASYATPTALIYLGDVRTGCEAVIMDVYRLPLNNRRGIAVTEGCPRRRVCWLRRKVTVAAAVSRRLQRERLFGGETRTYFFRFDRPYYLLVILLLAVGQ